jgi:hypothetical protein
MTKRSKRNNNRRGNRRSGNACTVKGKIIQSWAAQDINKSNTLTLHPVFPVVANSGTGETLGFKKTNGLHELWRYYRFKSVKFRWLHGSANVAGMYLGAASYTGGDMANAQEPVNTDDIYEQSHQFDPVTFISTPSYGSTAPITSAMIPSVPKRQSVPMRELLGRQPSRWYYCDPTDTVVSGALIYQGNIFTAFTAETGVNTQTVTYSFELEYVLEFSEFRLATVSTLFDSLGYKTSRSGGLQITQIEDDDDEKSGFEIDDASLSIIANSTTGFGAAATKAMLAERTKLAELQLAKARVSRLEAELKESSP